MHIKMRDPLDQVKAESERFLREEGAESCRLVGFLEFTEIVRSKGLESQVGVRDFQVGPANFTQAYVELNEGEYVYSSIIN